MRRAIASLAALAALALGAGASAQDMAITNATVALGDGSEPIEGGTVVVRGGRIVAAGAGVAVPAGVPVMDGTGRWVTPGLFAALTDIGLADIDAVWESNDKSAAGSAFSAALDVAPAINPAAQEFALGREAGVTRASVMPFASSSIFAGQGALIDLGADRDAVRRPRAFQYIELGESGARRAGGSRTSAHALLRNALREARTLDGDARIPGSQVRGQEQDFGDDIPVDPRLSGNDRVERASDALLTRFDAAALVPVLRGEQQLYVEVDRAQDILSAIALRSEFPRLDLVIVGAAEGWQVAREIAASGVPVIAPALIDLPEQFEKLASTQSNIGRMQDAGVTVAIGKYGANGSAPRDATQMAGNLVALTNVPRATGLTWGEALAAITSVPARISGLGGRAGVLAAGAAGDVVIWDGDPLELSSAPVAVYIDGVEQPFDSHQSRLKERYRDLDESDLPKAYDW